jgi:hypothetical protein
MQLWRVKALRGMLAVAHKGSASVKEKWQSCCHDVGMPKSVATLTLLPTSIFSLVDVGEGRKAREGQNLAVHNTCDNLYGGYDFNRF